MRAVQMSMTMILSGPGGPRSQRLLAQPEGVGLVEADIAAGIPGPVAFLRHIAHLRIDHDRLHDAVHRADREYLVDVDRQNLLPHLTALVLAGRLLPVMYQFEELAGLGHIAFLALLALGLDEHAPAPPLAA